MLKFWVIRQSHITTVYWTHFEPSFSITHSISHIKVRCGLIGIMWCGKVDRGNKAYVIDQLEWWNQHDVTGMTSGGTDLVQFPSQVVWKPDITWLKSSDKKTSNWEQIIAKCSIGIKWPNWINNVEEPI